MGTKARKLAMKYRVTELRNSIKKYKCNCRKLAVSSNTILSILHTESSCYRFAADPAKILLGILGAPTVKIKRKKKKKNTDYISGGICFS